MVIVDRLGDKDIPKNLSKIIQRGVRAFAMVNLVAF
jgi:hypothetical protein